jgi:hypothetical protein
MRTTLDIDDDVLEAAKELAAVEKKTAGRVLSDLARSALTAPRRPALQAPEDLGLVLEDGWYVLPRRGGIVTKEMVDRLIEQADLEEARPSLIDARAPRR